LLQLLVSARPAFAVAADFGFGSSLPVAASSSPALAHTGLEVDAAMMVAMGLLAAGCIIMGVRRQRESR